MTPRFPVLLVVLFPIISLGIRLGTRDIDFAPVEPVDSETPPTNLAVGATTTPPPEPLITPAPPETYTISVPVDDVNVTSAVAVSEDLMSMCNCANAQLASTLGCDPPLTTCTQTF